MKDITNRLKSQNAVVAVLVLALVANMPHAQHVFYTNSHDHSLFGWLQSWGAAIALEMAVLVFVIRGNIRVSWGFAVFSVVINLIYYYDNSMAWYVPRASWLLSAGLPAAIALYSHEVADNHDAPVQPTVQPTVQPKTKRVATVQPAIVPDVQPDMHTVQPDVQPDDDVQPEPKVLAAQLRSEGLSNAQIGERLGVHRNTVGKWLAAGVPA